MRCAAFWSWREHSWQRAVCQPTGSLAQGLLDGQMESVRGNEQRKMLKNSSFATKEATTSAWKCTESHTGRPSAHTVSLITSIFFFFCSDFFLA